MDDMTGDRAQQLNAEVTLRLSADQARRLASGAHVDIIVHDADGGFVAFAHDVDTHIDVQEGAPSRHVDAAAARRAIISLDSASPQAESLFRAAIVAIDSMPGNQVEGISPLYHVSHVDSADAMAAVIQISTRMDARELIGALGAVEATHEGAVDLDLVDMDGVNSDEPDCRVPWPSAREHAAVLAPWLEMDPDARLGGDPVSFLLAMAPDAGFVGMLSDDWILGAQGL